MSSGDSKLIQILKKKFPLEKNTKERPTIILTLDGIAINHISDEVKSYLEKFDSLEELSMVSCNLNSLNNFPELPNLLKIDLSDNHLKDADLKELLKYKKLTELRMANNLIGNWSLIQELEKLPLNFIDFSDCPISKMDKYREKFYENFKNLKILDFCDKEGKEWDEDDEEEEEPDEDDKEFIDDEGKNLENEENEENDEGNNNEEGEQYEDDGENEEYESNEEEEIKNPNPAKKKKTE
jgi:hypothetical protein